MKAAFFTIMLFLVPVSCLAQEQIEVERVTLPAEVRQEIAVPTNDPDIKDLQWNRWTSNSFVVCSLNDAQAQYLVSNLENIKNWIYQRWGFDNLNFVSECRLICVDKPELFEKFFNLKESRAEIRFDDSGKPELMVIFYLLDQPPSVVVPGPLTEICLFNLDNTYNIKSPPWVVRGISGLNETLPTIRSMFSNIELRLHQDEPMYFSQALFEITEDQYKALDDNQRKMYDEMAAALCLFLRKEYGQSRFHNIWHKCGSGGNPQQILQEQYGFASYDIFDQSFNRFLIDTTTGLRNGEINNYYLQVNRER